MHILACYSSLLLHQYRPTSCFWFWPCHLVWATFLWYIMYAPLICWSQTRAAMTKLLGCVNIIRLPWHVGKEATVHYVQGLVKNPRSLHRIIIWFTGSHPNLAKVQSVWNRGQIIRVGVRRVSHSKPLSGRMMWARVCSWKRQMDEQRCHKRWNGQKLNSPVSKALCHVNDKHNEFYCLNQKYVSYRTCRISILVTACRQGTA